MRNLILSKIFVNILSTLILLFALAPSAPAEDKPQYHLKIATIAPEGTGWADVFHNYADYVEKESGGRINVVLYLGAIMGDEPDEVRKLRIGQIQGAVVTLMGMGIVAEDFKVLELPQLIMNFQESDYVLEKLSPVFKQILKERDLVLAGWSEVGYVRIYTRIPINSIQDYDTTKFWSWAGEPVVEEALRILGVKNLFPLQLPEVLNSLKTGLVDSFIGSCLTIIPLQWYPETKYMSDFTYGYSPMVVLLDKKYFDHLPSDLQGMVLKGWRLFLPELTRKVREDEEKACRGLKARGLIENPSSPELLREVRARAVEVQDKLAGKYYPLPLLQK
ncbi:MAG: TRAP transporter substrate-binding protein DctP, partial [Proteobacteria bacterium]|nr:TRAP transporter substrate-binding protein DctP [Pseudomonadota bacterium]